MNRIALDIDADGRVESLRAAIAWPRGFSLIFVHAPPGPVRAELLARLQAWSGQDEMPKILEVKLRPAEWPHYRLQELGLEDAERVAVVLTGLEQHAVGEGVSPALASFNFARDLLPRLVPGPLVIVGSDEVFMALMRSASDLVSWRAYEISVHAAVEESPRIMAAELLSMEASEDAQEEVERLSALLQGVLTRRTGYGALEAARLRLRLGTALTEVHRNEEAEAELTRALETFRSAGREHEAAESLFWLGRSMLQRSDHEGARARLEEALLLHRNVGDALGEANCIHRLGDAAVERSDHEGARTAYEQALRLYEHISEPYAIGWTHAKLSRIAHNPALARHHREAARAAWTSIGRADLLATLPPDDAPPVTPRPR